MDDNLITATQLIPGIRELYVEDPWTWGQQLWKPGKGALAINSVRTRSQEQIHMHICRAHDETQKFLGQLDFTQYLKAMTEVTEKKWMCQAGETGATSMDGMVAKVQGQLANDRWCPDFIGAAMIADSKGRIWACVTTEESETTEFSFCY
jgi:CDP-diacylglycerol pyrophosphatase